MFLDADANLVDKVNNENMKKLSLEERSKLQTLAKRPMKQLKLELEASRLVEAETDCEIKVVKSSEDLSSSKISGGKELTNKPTKDQQGTIFEPNSNQKAGIQADCEIKVIRSSEMIEPTKQKVANRIPNGNNLPPDLTSALEAGLISPTELARMMAGELIDNPANNLGDRDKQKSSMGMISDDKQTSSNLKQPKESVEIDGSTIEKPEHTSTISDEELEVSTKSDDEIAASTINDEELATGWLDNDLLPSGWKLKIACDGKPSDEQVCQIFIANYGLCNVSNVQGVLRKIFMAPSGLTMAGAQAVRVVTVIDSFSKLKCLKLIVFKIETYQN